MREYVNNNFSIREMMKNRILILKSGFGDFEKFYITRMREERKDADVYCTYRFSSLWMQRIMTFYFGVLKDMKTDFWYGEWKNRLSEYDAVIVFDRVYSLDILEYIREKNPHIKMIFWLWNIVGDEKILRYKHLCEIWSFDSKECRKYGFRYNDQFYLPVFTDKTNVKNQAFFVGRNKGRLHELMMLKTLLEKHGVSVKYYICKNNRFERYKGYKLYNNELSYKRVLEYILESKFIIELVQEKQEGPSIRALEALFYGKKLITNNRSIIHLDFYHKNNIFVLGVDSDSEFAAFLDSPYIEIEETIRHRYTYGAWLDEFIMSIAGEYEYEM